MRVTIEKKTDQLNYEDFLGGVTRIVTIAGVNKGTKEQQYDIAIEEDSRVWRPAVTVLKLLVAAWGDDATEWVGRRAELYGDPTVTFGRDRVGGIRVSRVSHIDKPVIATLTETRGKRKAHTVDPLPDLSPIEKLKVEWRTAGPERRVAIEAEVRKLPENDVHGPHIECGNMGCHRRGLSGMHCRDNDECDGGPHEDCPVLARVIPPASTGGDQ